MNKQAVCWLLLLAGGGYALYDNWDAISDKLGLVELSPARAKAINLAKDAYNLDNYRTNSEFIATESRNQVGEVEQGEWVAEPRGSVYVVSYEYKVDGNAAGYLFQVDFQKIECKMIGKIQETEPAMPVVPR